MGIKEVERKESASSQGARQLSTIKFPYSDLGAALELAKAIKFNAGLSCELAQLATWMGQSVNGGSFRSRSSSAQMFGLIRTERAGSVILTDLGQEALNPQRAAEATVEAFLNVELFSTIYETHKGKILPPSPALERMMVSLGVTPKQQERARQTFIKSAKVAQFIDPKSGAFIRPGFPSNGDPALENSDGAEPQPKPSGRDGGDDGDLPPNLDPIIVGLITRLPDSGNVWPMEERTLWLDVLANIFKIVYKEGEQSSA